MSREKQKEHKKNKDTVKENKTEVSQQQKDKKNEKEATAG